MVTAWTITTAVLGSDMDGSGTDYGNGDSLTINSGGQVTWDLANADGAIQSDAVAVNAGAKLIYNPGTKWVQNTGTAITVAEGGQLLSLGTAASRVTIMGEDKTSGTHYIRTVAGGKIYMSYTDVSLFLYVGFYGSGVMVLDNTTITNTGYMPGNFNTMYGNCELFATNCTFNENTASRYALGNANYDIRGTFVGCAFVSTTDNYLMAGVNTCSVTFAGCTYQGVAIESNDIPLTTTDYDIRIYEASAVTETGGLSGVTDGITHPSMDTMGMLYDSTNYMKVPAFLSPPVTASGAATVYVLQKTAYWPSGLAVISRTWKYWSDSGQAETGDNAQYTHTLAKSGYVTATDTAWAGAAVSATLTAVQDNFRFDGGTW